jgi:hypothetical protein
MAIRRQSLGADFYWENRALKTLGRAALIIGIATLFLYRASETFVSDHSFGDQKSYLGIAMKLERFGFREYNLRRINRVYSEDGVEYVYVDQGKGELLQAYISEGVAFFDQPLFHAPPLFPYLLSFSHRMFSPKGGYKILSPAAAKEIGLKERIRAQLYSCFIPLFFGLALIVATFFLARMIFDYWTAVIAMFLVAISPVTILTSEILWADTLVASLVTLTVLLLFCYFRSHNASCFVLSAMAYSLALLTKNTAILLAPTLMLIAALFSRDRNFKRVVLWMGAFFFLVFVATFPWYYTVYSTWGTPMFDPKQEGISKVHFWFVFAKSRPWYTYMVSLPSMVPLYLFGYYRLINLLRSKVLPNELFLAIWFLTFFIVLTIITFLSEQLGPDSRYMLPAYPPLAILTALQLLSFKRWLESKLPVLVTRFALATILVFSSTWSFTLSDPFYAEFPAVYKHFMNMPW